MVFALADSSLASPWHTQRLIYDGKELSNRCARALLAAKAPCPSVMLSSRHCSMTVVSAGIKEGDVIAMIRGGTAAQAGPRAAGGGMPGDAEIDQLVCCPSRIASAQPS